jgi:hypothetical protein
MKVEAPAPDVDPWKECARPTTSYRPVTFLAILSAASLASPPVDRKKTRSSGGGNSSTTRRPSAMTSGLSIALLRCSARSAAPRTAWAMRG